MTAALPCVLLKFNKIVYKYDVRERFQDSSQIFFSVLWTNLAPASAKLNIYPTPKPQHTGTPDTQAPAHGHTRHQALSTRAHPTPKPQHAGTLVTQALSTRAHSLPKPSARGHTRYPSPQHAGTLVTQAPAHGHSLPKPSARGHTRYPSPQHAGTLVTQAPCTRAHPTPKPLHTGTPDTQAPAHGHTRHPSPSTWAHSDTPALILPPSIRLIPPFKHSSSLWRPFLFSLLRPPLRPRSSTFLRPTFAPSAVLLCSSSV